MAASASLLGTSLIPEPAVKALVTWGTEWSSSKENLKQTFGGTGKATWEQQCAI